MDRLDQKEIVCFTTFDPPDPLAPGVVGHFCLVVLNLKEERFELLDSMRGHNDLDASRVMHLMARNIKKLWREVVDDRGNSFNPFSIDDWPLQYINSARQKNTYDCGFFTLQNLQSYDASGLVIFNQAGMPSVRMTLLYSWMMNSDFEIDTKALLGVDPGPPLDLDESNFSIFETQFSTPEVHNIIDEPVGLTKSKAQKAIARLHPTVKTKKSNKAPTKEKVVALDDDDDDFGSDAVWKQNGKKVQKDVHASTADSSGDFVTQKPRQAAAKSAIITDKSTIKGRTLPKIKVPVLVPYKFPHLTKAKELKNTILSKEYLQNHGSETLLQFVNPLLDTLDIDGNLLYRLFAHCEMMEAETMDHIISYWKDSPEMNHVFESGDRVLLSPYAIVYLLDFAPFQLRDSKGNSLPRQPYDVKAGARIFKYYVRDGENLLVANLISRLVQLIKEVYGTDAYNNHFVHNWEQAAENCIYMKTPEQGPNECGFYALKISCIYDGLKLVRK